MKNRIIAGLLLISSLLIASPVKAQGTSVANAWQQHKHKCPSEAKNSGTWGQTKDFDITLCYVQDSNYSITGAYYIGKDKKSGNSITLYTENGKFVNKEYEYKLEDYGSYNKCNLQVLKNGKVILNQPLTEWMFNTPPCMFDLKQTNTATSVDGTVYEYSQAGSNLGMMATNEPEGFALNNYCNYGTTSGIISYGGYIGDWEQTNAGVILDFEGGYQEVFVGQFICS